MFCTNCGTANKDDAKFCIHCGDSLTETVIKKKPLRERLFKKAGFFQALLDFSFNQFVIPKVIKFLYGLSFLYAGTDRFHFCHPRVECLKGFRGSLSLSSDASADISLNCDLQQNASGNDYCDFPYC